MNLVNLRKQIIQCSFAAKEGHIPSALSILDVLFVLYDKYMNIEKIKNKNTDRDRFVLSKGHASLALYCVLAHNGIIPLSFLDDFCKYSGKLGGHPDTNKVPGVEASTGSLGHGFPIAVGMALGYKVKNISSRVFTLIGDGECNEGTIWESALIGSHHNLNNLTCIVDYNHSTDRALNMGQIGEKFESFGWDVFEIDGHDQIQIENALKVNVRDKPTAIIANTIKGKGCRPMENSPAWHHKSPSIEELPYLLEQLY
jgi:transketolase